MRPILPRVTALSIAVVAMGAGSDSCGGSPQASLFFGTGIQQEFAEAVAEGRSDKLDRLSSRGASVGALGKAGMSYVYWAVVNRSKDGLMYLLAHGADPNKVFDPLGNQVAGFPNILYGSSPISLAAKLEDPWFLKYLAEHGGDINLTNPISGQSPLVEALASNRRENVRYLISRGTDLNTIDRMGNTPLALAIENQMFDVAYELLVAGADPKIPIARNGATILTVLRHVPIPDPPQSEWRQKVINLLEQEGLDVANGS
jgi:uncharacterized protein